ncbi:MAG: hypothetical protein ABJA78_19500 [Ferruginibacter sp.]
MKLLKINILSLLTLTVIANVSCTRDIPQVAPTQVGLSSVATVQVFSATVKAARNYVYVDGVPVSGAVLAYSGIFPATAYSFIVNPGSRSISIKDTAVVTTQTPLTFSQAFDAGKSYTVFTYDTITSVKQLTVTNNITVPTDTSAMLRFANFIYNTTAVPAVDVYSFKKGATPLFTNVATAAVTDFVPYPSLVTDTLYVYATGTTTPLLAKAAVLSLTPTRSYTTVYSGSYKGTKVVSVFATY